MLVNHKRILKNQLVPGDILLYGTKEEQYLDGIVLFVDCFKGMFLYYNIKHGVCKVTFSIDRTDNLSFVLQ